LNRRLFSTRVKAVFQKKKIVVILFIPFFLVRIAWTEEESSSDFSVLQMDGSEHAVEGIISQVQEVIDAPFYDMGEVTATDVFNRRLSDLDYNYHLFPTQPFQVPGPPKLPKLPKPVQHIQHPSAQQIQSIQRIHSVHRRTVPHVRQQQAPPKPPRIPKLPPQPSRRR
jgi:hypothetical protein